MKEKTYMVIALLFVLLLVGEIVFITKYRNSATPAAAVDIESEEPTVAFVDAHEITHGDKSKKEVIFTFDGGDGAQSGNKILETLAKHHVKGTFFLTGKMIENHPDLVKQIAAGNNEIFSHTYDHKDLTKLSDSDIENELTKYDNLLIATVGTSSKPYFRAPYGARNAKVLSVAAEIGYESVYWTVDARDWMEPQGETPTEVENIILSSLAPGNIYLMHIGNNITGDILDDMFTKIESKGYVIVSLTQGL